MLGAEAGSFARARSALKDGAISSTEKHFFFLKVSEISKKGRETISVVDTGQLRFYSDTFTIDRNLLSLF